MQQNEIRDVSVFEGVEDLQVRLGEGDQANRLVGYAAVFNSLSCDLGGFRERLLPGCFAQSITNTRDIRALVSHDPDKLLGRTSNGTLRLIEDERGLRIEIDMPDVSYARDVRELINRRDVRGMSFGFRVRKDGEKVVKEGNQVIRELSAVDLREVSVVATPAYDATSVQLRVDPAVVEQARALGAPDLSAYQRRLKLAMVG